MYKEGQYFGPAGVYKLAMPLQRYFLLEREFRLVSRRMDDCGDAALLSELSKHREGVIVEARGILSKFDMVHPAWCIAK